MNEWGLLGEPAIIPAIEEFPYQQQNAYRHARRAHTDGGLGINATELENDEAYESCKPHECAREEYLSQINLHRLR